MVSWDASAEVLSELADEQLARDGALLRAAAGIHVANDNHIARQWVYVCPPAWNMTPREFAAACYYSRKDGMSTVSSLGLGFALSPVALPIAFDPFSPVGITYALLATPIGAALAASGPARRWMARRNVERMTEAGLHQVLEVSRHDFDGDHMFHTDLEAVDALRPGDMTEMRHRALRRLWLSAGGDPAVADTMPDKGWVSRSSRKQDGHWANRAILDIAFRIDESSKAAHAKSKRNHALDGCGHPDEINSPYCECAVCGDAEHDSDVHYEHQRYSYTAMDPGTGGRVSGMAKAASEREVETALKDSGLAPLYVASADRPNPFTPTAPLDNPAPRPAPTTMAGRWADALARFEAVEKEWDEIVTDPLAALDHAPLLDMRLMPDGSTSRTGLFVEAFGKAKDLRARHAAHSPATGPEDRADVIEFEDAARAAAVAWTEAKRWAKHVGINSLPESERDIARRARAALETAMHEFTPIEEAITAAETAARLLKSIHTVVLPEKAMLQIETKARKAIG